MMVGQPLDAAIQAAPTFAAMPPRPPVLFAPNWMSGLCSSGEYVWMILCRENQGKCSIKHYKPYT